MRPSLFQQTGQASRPPIDPTTLIVLAETDLLIARQFCRNMIKGWPAGICEAAKSAIFVQKTMVVSVDPSNWWYVRDQDFSFRDMPGKAGDYAAMGKAVQHEGFQFLRCLKFRDLPPDLGAFQGLCEWGDLQKKLKAIEDVQLRAGLEELCASAIKRLPDAARNSVMNSTEAGPWAAALLERAEAAEKTRLATADRLTTLPSARNADLQVIARAVAGATPDRSVKIPLTFPAGTNPKEPLGVMRLGAGSTIYVKARPGQAAAHFAEGSSIDEIVSLARDGRVELGISHISAGVHKVDADDVGQLLSELPERQKSLRLIR